MYQMLIFWYDLLKQQQQKIYMNIFYCIIDHILLLTSPINVFITKKYWNFIIFESTYRNSIFFLLQNQKKFLLPVWFAERKNSYSSFLYYLLLFLHIYWSTAEILRIQLFNFSTFWVFILQSAQNRNKGILINIYRQWKFIGK